MSDVASQPNILPLPRVTYEEFLDMAMGRNAEWVDGDILWMSPVTARHEEVKLFLLTLIHLFVEHHGLGRVFADKFQMRLINRPAGREPDIMFLASMNLHFLKNTYVDGPADLTMEIVSPESEERDRVTKFAEYQQGGVREYWLLEPTPKQATFYVLNAEGIYAAAPIGVDAIYRSVVLDGLWLKVDWLWQEPTPPVLAILKLWNIL